MMLVSSSWTQEYRDSAIREGILITFTRSIAILGWVILGYPADSNSFSRKQDYSAVDTGNTLQADQNMDRGEKNNADLIEMSGIVWGDFQR